jgi:hypothetical protein
MTIGGLAQAAARDTIRHAIAALRAEVVLTLNDARRADARDFRILAADLRGRADRLAQLASTLEGLSR